MAASFGGFGLGGVFSGVQRLEEAEQSGGFADSAELDAEGLNLDEEVLHVDDLVSDQRLKEDADQANQTILKETRNTTAGQRTTSCSVGHVQASSSMLVDGTRKTKKKSIKVDVSQRCLRPFGSF